MRKIIFITTIIILLIFLVGCDSALEEEYKGEGSIILTLSRDIINNSDEDGSDANYSGFTKESVSTLNEEGNDWPRTVEDIQEVLEGYRVRIEGEGVDVFKDAYFEEGEDETTIEMFIPANDNYEITLLALSKASNLLYLLGAGNVAGITVRDNETNVVTIPMDVYKYNFEVSEKNVSTGEEINIIYDIKGPLISSIYSGTSLYYSMDFPDDDGFGERVSAFTRKEISNDHLRTKFNITGQSDEGKLYFQVAGSIDSEWRYDGTSFIICTPSIKLKEEIPSVNIGEANNSIVIEPEW